MSTRFKQQFSAHRAIAQFALGDLLRERVLYNVIFVALFLMFFGYLAALLVFGHQDRVMLDFGTMVNALSVYVVAASAGARSLRNEIEQRTLYLALTRPVDRTVYYVSKWCGLSAFLGLNLALLTLVLSLALKITGGPITSVFLQSMALIWCETLWIGAFSFLLSLFVRPGLNLMVVFAYLFISHNHEQLSFLKNTAEDRNGFLPVLMSFLQNITPEGQVFLLDTRVYYQEALSVADFVNRMGYGVLWSLVFISIGSAVFHRKDI